MTVTSSSTVKWGSSRLRVALVLDNTGSMADSGKITALKTATANLLTQLQNAATRQRRRLCLDHSVREGRQSRPGEWNSDWIYWGTTGAAPRSERHRQHSWDANNGTCSCGNYSPRSTASHATCSISGTPARAAARVPALARSRATPAQSTCTGAGTCSLSGYTSSGSCTGAGTCSISTAKPRQSSCTGRGHLARIRQTTRATARHQGLHQSQYTSTNHAEQRRHLLAPGRA